MKKEVNKNPINPGYPTKSDLKGPASPITKGIAAVLMATTVSLSATACGSDTVKPRFEQKREPKPTEELTIEGEIGYYPPTETSDYEDDGQLAGDVVCDDPDIC